MWPLPSYRICIVTIYRIIVADDTPTVEGALQEQSTAIVDLTGPSEDEAEPGTSSGLKESAYNAKLSEVNDHPSVLDAPTEADNNDSDATVSAAEDPGQMTPYSPESTDNTWFTYEELYQNQEGHPDFPFGYSYDSDELPDLEQK